LFTYTAYSLRILAKSCIPMSPSNNGIARSILHAANAMQFTGLAAVASTIVGVAIVADVHIYDADGRTNNVLEPRSTPPATVIADSAVGAAVGAAFAEDIDFVGSASTVAVAARQSRKVRC
jgi:hypothetical protein